MSVKNLNEGSLASISEFQKFDQNLLKEFDTSFFLLELQYARIEKFENPSYIRYIKKQIQL